MEKESKSGIIALDKKGKKYDIAYINNESDFNKNNIYEVFDKTSISKTILVKIMIIITFIMLGAMVISNTNLVLVSVLSLFLIEYCIAKDGLYKKLSKIIIPMI